MSFLLRSSPIENLNHKNVRVFGRMNQHWAIILFKYVKTYFSHTRDPSFVFLYLKLMTITDGRVYGDQ